MQFSLAVDLMGGDQAPKAIIDGVSAASLRYPFVHFLLFGDADKVEFLLARAKTMEGKYTLVDCKEVITPEMKPSFALRGLPNSSMRQAIMAVVDGRAKGVISAGNTGAYMALAKMLIKTIPGIERPALASLAPTLKSEIVFLDLGANVQCSPTNLQQFAIMGETFARLVLHLPKPKVGLINVGTEDIKGNTTVKEAFELIRSSSISDNFYGYIEGNDIARGTVDVVIMDGFTGNVVLKASEGALQFALHYFKEAFKSSWMASLGYLFARPMLKKLSLRLDYRRYNGGIWLGLNGIAIKSHGSADALGFGHALDLAVDMVTSGINEDLRKEFTAAPRLKEVVNK